MPPIYDCSRTLHLLYPHLDGELDAKESLLVHEHLDLCPPCRDIFIAERWMQTVTGPSLTPIRAPESLRRKVISTVSDEARRAGRWLIDLRTAVVAAAFGTVAVIACLLTFSEPTQVSPLVQSAVAEHNRYSTNLAQLPIVAATNPMVAKQLEQHLPFQLGVPPEPVSGIQLLGGAVLWVEKAKAALLVYRVHGTPVSLLLTTPQEVVVPPHEVVTFKNIVLHAGNVDGYHTLQWSDRRFTYVLVSKEQEAAHRACVICHNSPQGRDTIAGFVQGI